MQSNHPCFNKNAHQSYGRMHLPVAPDCNIRCGYCSRKYSCANESRPGVTAQIIAPEEALRLAKKALARHSYISVAGIAGPGDPLANPEATIKTLTLIRASLPDLHLCISTNGLALPDYAEALAQCGVKYLTVTVNAVDPDIGARIYQWVKGSAGKMTGKAGASYLLDRQIGGILKAKSLGMTIKINMVIVPGINDFHAPDVAQKMASLGADLMNCIPMAPVHGAALSDCGQPAPDAMDALRKKSGQWLPQMLHCGRCRADALGFIGDHTTIATAPEKIS